jgi:hypothetical protein
MTPNDTDYSILLEFVVFIYKEVLNSVDCLAACALIGDWFVNS